MVKIKKIKVAKIKINKKTFDCLEWEDVACPNCGKKQSDIKADSKHNKWWWHEGTFPLISECDACGTYYCGKCKHTKFTTRKSYLVGTDTGCCQDFVILFKQCNKCKTLFEIPRYSAEYGESGNGNI